MCRWAAVLPSLIAMVTITTAASAQDATPTDDPIVADPALCLTSPRSLAGLSSFVGTPPPDYTPTVEIEAVPPGEPVDAETRAGVTETITALYACFSANDWLRAFALFTDDALYRGFLLEGMTDELLGETYGTPIPPLPPEDWWTVYVGEISLRDDGRIGAVVVEVSPFAPDVENPVYMVLTPTDDGYLIDDALRIEDESL